MTHDTHLVLLVVDREEVLHDGPLALGGAGVGADEVLGIVVVVHPLEARGAERGQQRRHDEEVARLAAHQRPELEEELLEGVIHNPETRGAPPPSHGHVVTWEEEVTESVFGSDLFSRSCNCSSL